MTSYERISQIDWNAVANSKIKVTSHDPRGGVFHHSYRTDVKVQVWQEGASRPSWRYIYLFEVGPYLMSSEIYNEIPDRQRIMILDVPEQYKKAINKKILEVIKLAASIEK